MFGLDPGAAPPLAESAAGVVDVEFAPGLADDFGGLGDLGQVGDAQEAKALAAAHTPIGGGCIQPPAVAAMRTFGNDVHPITSSWAVVYKVDVSL